MRRWQLGSMSGVLLILAILMILQSPDPAGSDATAAESTQAAAAAQEPVEEDDHHFMEYVFDPPFQRLKTGLAAPPQDAAAWKAIRSDGLILAEAANLLLIRESAGDDVWDAATVASRREAGKLYRAAAKSDYPAARETFKSLISNCNKCHEDFGGPDLEL